MTDDRIVRITDPAEVEAERKRLAALPKWARERIELAERDRDHYRDALHRLQTHGPAASRLTLDLYGRGVSLPLEEGGVVVFRVARRPGAPKDREGEVRVQFSDNHRRTITLTSSEGGLAVMPGSGNLVKVTAVSWAFPESEREPRGGGS